VAEGIAHLGEPVRSHDEGAKEMNACIRRRSLGLTDDAMAVHLEGFSICDRSLILFSVDCVNGGNGSSALGTYDTRLDPLNAMIT